jgi:mannose-6-phosphate isomerase-like protein (cupin superfamily)
MRSRPARRMPCTPTRAWTRSTTFLLEGAELPMRAGDMLVAPDGVPHGVRNTGDTGLVVLAVLAPGNASESPSTPSAV